MRFPCQTIFEGIFQVIQDLLNAFPISYDEKNSYDGWNLSGEWCQSVKKLHKVVTYDKKIPALKESVAQNFHAIEVQKIQLKFCYVIASNPKAHQIPPKSFLMEKEKLRGGITIVIEKWSHDDIWTSIAWIASPFISISHRMRMTSDIII